MLAKALIQANRYDHVCSQIEANSNSSTLKRKTYKIYSHKIYGTISKAKTSSNWKYSSGYSY